jgi:protein associated with RNAse G/E
MRRVKVLSTKYDGSLRDEYETYLYADTEEAITLFSPAGLPYWDYRKDAWLQAEDGLIEIYFKHRWYNVWHICEQVSLVNLTYVNISMPVMLEGNGIQWTDLDLDYRVHLDSSVEQLDQADYEHNARRMGYPRELMTQVQAACREVEAGLAAGIYPFDHERQVELYRQLKANLSSA